MLSENLVLLVTMQRAGSTLLFDLLSEQPAFAMCASARFFALLGLYGSRYPHDLTLAVGPGEIELKPRASFDSLQDLLNTGKLRGAALDLISPRWRYRSLDVAAAERLDSEKVAGAIRWYVEKCHPEFYSFKAECVAARIAKLRENGIGVQVIYVVRDPHDALRSHLGYQARNPKWYPRFRLNNGNLVRYYRDSLKSMIALHERAGGGVLDYGDLIADQFSTVEALLAEISKEPTSSLQEGAIRRAMRKYERSSRTSRSVSPFFGSSEQCSQPASIRLRSVLARHAATAEECVQLYSALLSKGPRIGGQ
jgi:hypothetical protein